MFDGPYYGGTNWAYQARDVKWGTFVGSTWINMTEGTFQSGTIDCKVVVAVPKFLTSSKLTNLDFYSLLGKNAVNIRSIPPEAYDYDAKWYEVIFTNIPVTSNSTPSAPKNFTATPGNAQVALSWTTPNDGGSAITKYQYKYQRVGYPDGTWTDIPGSGASTTSYTVIGLTNNYNYSFQVRAVNTNGNGFASSGVLARPFDGSLVQINDPVIAGVTPPFVGGTPVTTVTETEQYTGMVFWTGSPSVFGYGTVYTANIEIYPKPGFTVLGMADNFFTVAGTSAPATGYPAGSNTRYDVTAVFPATAADTRITINIAAIEGVTPPQAGATPVTTIIPTAQYTGTVTWTPAHATFENGMQYTAKIILTPKSGYRLDGVPASFFNVAGAETTFNSTGSGEVTALFPATALAVGLTPGDNKVTLAPQAAEAGITYYYTSSSSSATPPAPYADISSVTGATAYAASTDITTLTGGGAVTNGTAVFVQVYKYHTSLNMIIAYGEASATPSATPLPLTFTGTYSIPASTVGTAIAGIDVSGGVAGGVPSYSFAATGLPAGITISAAGIISGTPTTAGAAGTATITVADSDTPTAATASITIAYGAISAPFVPLTFTHSTAFNIPASTVGTAIASRNVSSGASGGTTPYIFSATGLPAGISISTAGVISGAPTTAGAAGTATITVTDATSATASITINYGVISAATPPTGTAPTISGQTSMTLKVSYAATSTTAYTITGTSPVTVTKTSGNAAITYDNATRKLNIAAGLTAGTYTVTLQASNAFGSRTLTFKLTVEELTKWDEALALIEKTTFDIKQEQANTEDDLRNRLAELINELIKSTGIVISPSDIYIFVFEPATAGDKDNLPGTNGTFQFRVTPSGITPSAYSSGTITAKLYTVANETISAPTLNAYADNGVLHISGLTKGKTFYIYTLSGRLLYTAIATGDKAENALPGKGIYIVTDGKTQLKIMN
jgi:hypothetical protein